MHTTKLSFVGIHLFFSLLYTPKNKSRLYLYFSTLKRSVSHRIIDKCVDFHKNKFHKHLFIASMEQCYWTVPTCKIIFRIGICGIVLFCLFIYVDKIFEQIYSLSFSLNDGTKHFAWAIKYIQLFSDFVILSVLIWPLGTSFQLLHSFPHLAESPCFMCNVSPYKSVARAGSM